MKNNLNKILIFISLIAIMSGCHTLEHKSLFLVNHDIKAKVTSKKVITRDVISKKNPVKTIKPLNRTVKKKIKAQIVSKKMFSEDEISKKDLELVAKTKTMVALSETKFKKKITKIDLKVLKNISEKELYSKISKGSFTKQEGKLKNIQYYFSECFLDVFLIKRNNVYITDFIQIRSTELNSFIDKEKCLIEIASKLN